MLYPTEMRATATSSTQCFYHLGSFVGSYVAVSSIPLWIAGIIFAVLNIIVAVVAYGMPETHTNLLDKGALEVRGDMTYEITGRVPTKDPDLAGEDDAYTVPSGTQDSLPVDERGGEQSQRSTGSIREKMNSSFKKAFMGSSRDTSADGLNATLLANDEAKGVSKEIN
jgi:hypothetical protein